MICKIYTCIHTHAHTRASIHTYLHCKSLPVRVNVDDNAYSVQPAYYSPHFELSPFTNAIFTNTSALDTDSDHFPLTLFLSNKCDIAPNVFQVFLIALFYTGHNFENVYPCNTVCQTTSVKTAIFIKYIILKLYVLL